MFNFIKQAFIALSCFRESLAGKCISLTIIIIFIIIYTHLFTVERIIQIYTTN